MRVLFINTVFGKGSTGRIVQEIGEVLEKFGHEYVVMYGRTPKSEDPHAIFIGNSRDANIHAALARITDRCGFYSTEATKKAIQYIREYHPDVIHLHNLHGYYINIRLLFSYLKNEYKGKVIWTLHDCWAFTGHCVHYTYAKCDKWKTQCSNCPERTRYPASYVLDSSAKNYFDKKYLFSGLPNLTLVTPSKWLAEQVNNSFLQEYSCKVINNGIDLEVFKYDSNHQKHKILLNICDGLDERKGYKDLIEISRRVNNRYQVVVVGVKDKEKKFFPEDIKVVTRTNSQKELVEYYSNAEYLINTTYEDTFPTVNIESLACGTPVITYRSGGSPEIVSKYTGYVVDPGDIDSIVSILQGSNTIDASKCREQAMSYNKWDKYQEYITLYQQ